MKLSIKQIAFFLILVLSSFGSWAINFDSFDPKSMAMGGAGVAIADPAIAAFFNPALLSIAEENEDYALEFPVLGGRFGASEDLVDNIDEAEGLADNLTSEIDNFNSIVGSNGNIPVGSTSELTSAIDAMDDNLVSLDEGNLYGSAGAGFVFAIPSESFGLAISFSASGDFAGEILYNDSETFNNISSDVSSLDSCYNGSNIQDPTVINCIATTQFTYVETNPNASNFGEITFDTEESLESEASMLAVGVAEFGVSISREFTIAGSEIALGITPKSVSVTVVDYTADAQTVEDGLDDLDDYSETYEDFNFDLGIAKDFKNGWRAGSTIKNVIGKEYKTVNPENSTKIIKISPQVRAGISYQNDWATIVADLDLTENDLLKPLNGETKQYAAFGVESNAWDFVQLRAGYRSDLSNSGRDVVSLGFGVSPWGVHLDLAVAIGENSDDGGLALQTGFRF